MIVGERPGRIRIVGKNGKLSEPLDGMPPTSGLTDRDCSRCARIARSPRTAGSSHYTVLPAGSNQSALPRSPGVLMVASATLSSDERRLENLKVLLNAEGTGGRLIQAPDGTLLITSTIPSGVGINAVDWPQPQQLTSNMGKVLRINADGSIPKDNPFAGRGDAHPEIFALGIRDSQGVAIDPRTGALWLSEHGPRGGDEINAIARGKNYGFPVIGYGREYTGKPINGDKTAQDGMEQPVYFWTPDIAPAGHRVLHGRAVPGVARRPVRVGARRQGARPPGPQGRPCDRRRAAADGTRRANPRSQPGTRRSVVRTHRRQRRKNSPAGAQEVERAPIDFLPRQPTTGTPLAAPSACESAVR
jgi:Glucose/sorbosone dehydrogenases